ncbi:MAG: GDP-mannose dehydrogenase [Candidatus Bathyarchaeota archaeon]|jgi:UDP-N-acetyl-D-mannosaminuronate dehydrogenase|nr:GDP-mannose dehydrogenase [Candidatus Bathyarchaeota archaeon A05DMB-5]MDH7557151.1 GDP-mannose dehydrogenase [Candidatus Bathyarchaeota archaeon]
MPKESVLIVGLGEVGGALFELFRESGKFEVHGFDLDKKKMREISGAMKLPKMVDVMHICYPCTKQETFVKVTIDYIKKINPKLTIIESTVPPLTTQKIYEATKSHVVHSPIRGMHQSVESMKRDIMFWSKYIGGFTKEATERAQKHYEKLGLKVNVLKSPVETELAKLFETTYRAWMIVCFQEMHRISRRFNADFDEVVDMLEDIHRLRLNKPIHYPDVIGGHCLIPNTELLLSVYDSKFLRLILESNEKRKKEIKDKIVKGEIEKVKKRADTLQKELMSKLGKHS